MLPLVPLAQAAPAAGHEFAVATDDGNAVEAYEELVRTVTEMLLTESCPGPKTAAYVGAVFGEACARMVDGVVTTARERYADAVFCPPNHAAGLVAPRATGLPAVPNGSRRCPRRAA
ncbi:hypothetical protein [Streptomyces sp. NBC_00280]|uniref:hypothetical protein n=1 Tax=Streptomyces sp. NBC_00280 TaxID=2975699 RepID=UPI00324F6BE3